VSKRVRVEDLVTAQDITERLDLSRPQVVHNWHQRGQHDFPQPLGTVGNQLVWHWPEVRTWARRSGRL
jgi:hypothetical protein